MPFQLIPETPVQGRPLGRHVDHDPRSRAYPAEAAGPKAALSTVRWKRHGQVLDQGQLGSCTTNALCGALNTEPHYRPRHLLHEEDAVRLYSAATRLDAFPGEWEPDDTGSSGLAACKAAKQAGLIGAYRHAFGVEHALAALQLGPVVTGIEWETSFDEPDAQGIVKLGGTVRGGHEVEVIGYDADTQLVEAVNSWGRAYGVAGHFFFAVGDWATLLSRHGDVTVPVLA